MKRHELEQLRRKTRQELGKLQEELEQLKKGKAQKCTNCQILGLKRYHWANRSRQYKRDLDDWIELCPKCNKASDMGRLVI